MQRYPLIAAAIARPAPVLPDVGSTIVPPGFSFPSCSAFSIIARPMRSLTEPPGFKYSSFASSLGCTRRPSAASRTIGVLPTSSSPEGSSRAIGGSLVRELFLLDVAGRERGIVSGIDEEGCDEGRCGGEGQRRRRARRPLGVCGPRGHA